MLVILLTLSIKVSLTVFPIFLFFCCKAANLWNYVVCVSVLPCVCASFRGHVSKIVICSLCCELNALRDFSNLRQWHTRQCTRNSKIGIIGNTFLKTKESQIVECLLRVQIATRVCYSLVYLVFSLEIDGL